MTSARSFAMVPFLITTVTVLILVSGSRPAHADVFPRDPGGLDHAVTSTPPDLELSLELLVPYGSSADSGASQVTKRPDPVPAVVTVPVAVTTQRPEPEPWAENDPWAEAVVEAHHASPPPRAHLSPYPVVMNDQVRFFLERFTGDRREVVDLWMTRAGRYLGMIRDVLRRNGLPEDLAFTAMIESGFNPVAVSRAGAKGMWQFMAATARRYGLRVDQWVDERLDPEKATGAAAAYFRDLHGIFGSWTLAQAAYNAGEMKVIRALRTSGSKDFWPLTQTSLLKRETKDFVPQIQAAVMIGRDPSRYGFDVKDPEPLALERVEVPAATDLRRLSSAAGMSSETLSSLNPALVKGVTPPGGPWDIKIPHDRREAVMMALAPASPRTTVTAQKGRATRAAGEANVHVVRPRETVSSIAKQYGMSAGDVMRMNSLQKQDSIRPGDRLRITESRPTR
jgi:membrane-bound lytic murein transglycosylase D